MINTDAHSNFERLNSFLRLNCNGIKWETCNWGTGFMYDNKGNEYLLNSSTTIEEAELLISKIRKINSENINDLSRFKMSINGGYNIIN